ncbi:hypothetical protein HanIR_Chr01g0030751 [Helianthus annuus]|nr:hypothetical protein HanIR_Chr01g0030751 [Helianthus annuus]
MKNPKKKARMISPSARTNKATRTAVDQEHDFKIRKKANYGFTNNQARLNKK